MAGRGFGFGPPVSSLNDAPPVQMFNRRQAPVQPWRPPGFAVDPRQLMQQRMMQMMGQFPIQHTGGPMPFRPPMGVQPPPGFPILDTGGPHVPRPPITVQ